MPRGGKRAKAGRPPGSLEKATLQKRAIRHYWLKRLEKDAARVYDAQIAQACGTKFLVVRDKASGKFTPVTEAQAKMLAESEEVVEVWERPASTQAFVALADRTIDKPMEQVEMTGANKGPVIVKWQD